MDKCPSPGHGGQDHNRDVDIGVANGDDGAQQKKKEIPFFVRGGGSNRVIGPRTGIDKALQTRKEKESSACHIISFEHEQSCSSERYICICSCQTFQGPCCQGSELFPVWRAFISCFKAE